MYKAKTLFTGYKISMKDKNLYVGVPDKYEDSHGEVVVQYIPTREIRKFKREQIVDSREFPDKFGPGTYTLNYYLWKRR